MNPTLGLPGKMLIRALILASLPPHAHAQVTCTEISTSGVVGSERPAQDKELLTAATLAELSHAVYECRDGCSEYAGKLGQWTVILDSREYFRGLHQAVQTQIAEQQSAIPGMGAAGSTPSVIVPVEPEPAGFHALAFARRDAADAVIAFEGTSCLTCIRDWGTNFSQPFWTPAQFSAAEDFAREVIRQRCGDAVDCRATVSVTGHSLGGALAQYVAARLGLSAQTFNAAGLWRPTTSTLGADELHTASIQHNFSQAYRLGTKYGADLVPHLGQQIAQTVCEVPVKLPVWAWDAASVELLTHSIAQLSTALSNQMTATDRSAAPVVTPPALLPYSQAALDRCISPDSRRRREEGEVIMHITVSASGYPTSMRIVRSSGLKGLDLAAECIYRQFRFKPATKNGQPIESQGQLPFKVSWPQ